MSREFLTYFTFNSKQCICVLEKRADDITGSLKMNLALKEVLNKKISMGYYYGEGLKIINTKNHSKNNILGEFLGIKKDDLLAYKSFFEKYGFLFDLKSSNFNRVSIDKLEEFKNNLLAFVFLLNNQLENVAFYKSNNVKELLDGTLYLLFKNESELAMDGTTISRIEENKIMKIINSANSHNERLYNKKQKTVNGQIVEYFDIEDSLSNSGFNEIDVEKFEELISGDSPHWFINLCRVYKNKKQFLEDSKYNIIIDFLFNFATKYIVFLKSDISLNGTFEDNLYHAILKDSKMLDALINVSKILLEDEFEISLNSVTPIFSVKDMKPDWKLPSLYTALYFSLFYMNNKENGLRKCSNENCHEFFQVSKTNSRKKYCSILCCNSVSQRNYQKKQILKKK